MPRLKYSSWRLLQRSIEKECIKRRKCMKHYEKVNKWGWLTLFSLEDYHWVWRQNHNGFKDKFVFWCVKCGALSLECQKCAEQKSNSIFALNFGMQDLKLFKLASNYLQNIRGESQRIKCSASVKYLLA